MKRIALFIAGIVLAFSCLAEPVSDKDQAAITGVINTLLVSLQTGDNEVAFALHHPTVQSKFGTAARYAQVVREYYAPLVTHTSAVVIDIGNADDEVLAGVMLDDGGAIILAVFTLEINTEGIWQISACELFRTNQKGA